ncbi:MAG: recombination protein RecR [Clostridia bacterium]|nr:recombination protein RecR [Clostridia bacterium]
MDQYVPCVERLIEQFHKLPGIGRKSAVRMAFYILGVKNETAEAFANAILEAKQKIHRCSVCGDLTDGDKCRICTDPKRDHGVICVVSDPKDAAAIERTREYKGVYHVLHGVINPITRVGPDDIAIRELLDRLGEGVREVILATDQDAPGETTAMYIARLVKPFGIKVTRLAYGMSMGSHLEFTDELTLNKALEDRKSF